jgi:hypothetical protein
LTDQPSVPGHAQTEALAVSRLQQAGEPVDVAIEFARRGNLEAARQALQVQPTDITDREFEAGLSALWGAVELFKKERAADAAPQFETARKLVNCVGLQDTRVVLFVAGTISTSLHLFRQGDVHGAIRLFETLTQFADDTKFRFPELALMGLLAKAMMHVALARTEMANIAYPAAEAQASQAKSVYRECLELARSLQMDLATLEAEVHAISVEFSIAFASPQLLTLQFDDAERHILGAQESARTTRTLINKVPAEHAKKILTCICDIHETLKVIIPISRRLIREQDLPTADMLKKIEGCVDRLFTVRQEALAAGPQGVLLKGNAEQLRRYVENLLPLAKPRREKVVPIAGLVAGGALIVLLAVVFLIIRPEGGYALALFFGCMIMSLIIGFGYGALKFIPLLKLYKDTMRHVKSSVKAAASSTE